MTPKEKAKVLVQIMKLATDEFGYININMERHKQCALIAVNEILDNYYKNHFQTGKKIDYWKEVKQEIEKL
ncbi:hypothetical protein UFOVP309_4 [uncultured Caudovirales phage]|uniref:Uncharacterized protein n=1 Tax=uncultured Caudovirales phage TaxID=2100421 RepID=A0A6J5PUS4_9CAUD|nr:hypothetical protein UFOVP309_4 [uncultured Caudovirales phage]CAB4172945.1 hypothetical protein UFOVP946_11 [uncultured Caudovirales phage]